MEGVRPSPVACNTEADSLMVIRLLAHALAFTGVVRLVGRWRRADHTWKAADGGEVLGIINPLGLDSMGRLPLPSGFGPALGNPGGLHRPCYLTTTSHFDSTLAPLMVTHAVNL